MSVLMEQTHRSNIEPGGHSGNQGELKVVKDDSSCENVACSGKHNGICPRSEEDGYVIEINVLCRENGPGGHRGEWETSRAVERDWRRKFDVSVRCTDNQSWTKFIFLTS